MLLRLSPDLQKAELDPILFACKELGYEPSFLDERRRLLALDGRHLAELPRAEHALELAPEPRQAPGRSSAPPSPHSPTSMPAARPAACPNHIPEEPTP